MRKMKLLAAGLLLGLVLTGCSGKKQEEVKPQETEAEGTEAGTEQKTEAAGTEAETEEKAEAAGTEAETEAAGTEAETEQETEPTEPGLFGFFETKTLEGEEADQSIFAGADLTMVNIWGTFCSPCIQEMPELGEIAAEYRDKGVQLVGIISDVAEAGDETALQIVEKTKADYTHLVNSQDLWNNYLAEVQAVPTTIFVDKYGRQVGEVLVGSRSKDEWISVIEELLEQEEDR